MKSSGGNVFTDCVVSAGHSLAQVCFMIAAFGVLTGMLDSTGVLKASGHPELARAFLDVTAVEGLPHGDWTLLPWLSALVSFGGVCVIFQIGAIASGRLDLRPFIIIRTSASVFSFWICRLIMPFMLRNVTAEVSAMGTSLHSAPSPVPSIMLMLMTLAVISDSLKNSRCKL